MRVVSRRKPKVTDCQDISKASTGLRTITARIRNVKADLQELGEEMDENTNTVAKYREMLINLSGVDIMDGNEFKSTYQILEELSKVWSTLSDENRAAITTQVAGTRMTNVFEGIIHNFQQAEDSLTGVVSGEADGAIDKAMEDVLNSIEGSLAKLSVAWEDFSNKILNSELVTGAVDFLSTVLGYLNELLGWSGFGDFVKGLLAVSAAILVVRTSMKALGAEIATINKTSQVLFLIGTVASGISGVISLIKDGKEEVKKIDYVEKLKEDASELKEINDNLAQQKSEYNEIKGQLETLTKLKTNGNIATSQEEELIRLQKQNAEHERQIALLEQEQEEKLKIVEEDFNNITKERAASDLAVGSLWFDAPDKDNDRSDLYNFLRYGGKSGEVVSSMHGNMVEVPNPYSVSLPSQIENLNNPNVSDLDKEVYILPTLTRQRDYIEDILQSIGVSGYYEDSDIDDVQKEINALYSLYRAYEDAIAYQQGNLELSTLINGIVSKGRDIEGNPVDYQSLIDEVTKMYKSGEIPQGLPLAREYLEPEFKEIYNSLLEQLQVRGVDYLNDDIRSILDQILEGVYTFAENDGNSIEDIEKSLSERIESISKLKDAVSSLATAYSDFSKDGAVSYSAIEKISQAFADVEGIQDYIDTLSSADLTQEKLSQTLSKLGGKYLDAKAASEGLTSADEDLISSMLKEAGVANAAETAHRMVVSAKLNAKVATYDFKNAEDSEIQALVLEARQLGITENELVSFLAQKILSNQNQMNESESVEQLIRVAEAAGIATQRIELFRKAQSNYEKAERGGFFSGLYKTIGDIEVAIGSLGLKTSPTFTDTSVGISTGGSAGGGSSGGGSSGGGSSGSTEDTWKKAYDQERKALDHLRKMEYITEEVYYKRLDALNQKYFAGRSKYIDEYRGILEELHEGYKALFNEDWGDLQYKLDSIAESDYDAREKVLNQQKQLIIQGSNRFRKEMAPYLSKYDIDNSEYIQELGNHWRDVTEQIKQLNIDRLNSRVEALDQIVTNEENMLDRSAGKQVAIEREKQRQIEKAYKDGYLTFKEYIEKMNDSLAAEMDAVQENYDTALSVINDYIDEKIDALQTENDELEKQKELQDSLNELEKARAQRNKRLYVEGIGFIWTADQEAIQTAEERYNELTSDNALDEQIRYWEDLRTSLEEILNMADEEYNNDVTEMLLGENWREKLEEGQKFIQEFTNAYVDAVDTIQNKSNNSNSNGSLYPNTGRYADVSTYLKLRGYSDGGVANFTGLAKLHGSPSSPETIFNSADSAKLYSLIHNTPNLIDLVYHDLVSSAKTGNITSNNGINIDLGGIVINGNADQTTVDSLSEMLDRKIIQMSNMIRQTSLQKSYNQWGVN